MSNKRSIRTFENSKLKIVTSIELAQRLKEKAEGVDLLEITKQEAQEVELLYERYKGINSAKWARIVKGGQYLQLGQYVGSISTSTLNVLISPKVDKVGQKNQEGCVDLSVLVLSAKCPDLPTEEFAESGVMDQGIFFLHAERFIKDLSAVISFGLRCGYVAVSEELKSLRGTLDTDRLALKAGVTPELIPCKFEEFEENTLHNQILKRAVVIIRKLIHSFKDDPRSGPLVRTCDELRALVRTCDELLEQLTRVSDVQLQWSDVASLQLSSLEARYYGIFHYAKLLIKCVAPIDQDARKVQETKTTFQSGFSQVWDPAVLYERHIANYLESKLYERHKKGGRYRIRTQSQCSRLLVKKVLTDEMGYYQILPDIIIWDTKEDRAHLIIDTKWKNYEGSMSDARQADAYQVHAYATTYSKHYKTPKGIDKTYYPPVCLLYPSIGSARAPVKGRFTGTNSLFILASAPMDKDNYQFDPSVVLGDEWP